MAKLIQIVEDDIDIARAMADVLEAEGYRVVLAANGREALAQLRGGKQPALILLDLMMPVMNGWRFREEQQKAPELAAIPVITVTADGDARKKASAMNADGYLHKPVTIDGLLDEVERACGEPELDSDG